jgi:hypothetical protein
VGWGLARVGHDGAVAGSPFVTACVVRILNLVGYTAGIEEQRARSIAWLLEHQDGDGGWAASARLLSPRADVTDRAASDLPTESRLDDARTFTTAAVLWALAGSRA